MRECPRVKLPPEEKGARGRLVLHSHPSSSTQMGAIFLPTRLVGVSTSSFAKNMSWCFCSIKPARKKGPRLAPRTHTRRHAGASARTESEPHADAEGAVVVDVELGGRGGRRHEARRAHHSGAGERGGAVRGGGEGKEQHDLPGIVRETNDEMIEKMMR